MCGRFAQYTPPERLARYFEASLAAEVEAGWQPRWNIGPTRLVLAITAGGDPGNGGAPGTGQGGAARALDTYRWGLVPPASRQGRPSASGSGSTESRLFNARAETAAERPSFKDAYRARRAVVPADGFYEWRRGPGNRRQAHYFHRADGRPLSLAALWEPRPGTIPAPPDTGGWLRSCTLLTTAAGPDMDGVHARMPVVLDPEALALWLDTSIAEPSALDPLVRPAARGTLVHHTVGPRVGNVRNDGADLILPDRPAPAPLKLPLA